MEDISYKLTFEERDDYLYVCIAADSVSFEMIIDYTNKIVNQVKSSGHKLVMLVNETPVLPSTDCYIIASYIVKNAFSVPIRIAVVDRSPVNSRKQEHISEMSREAGLDIRSFGDEESAEKWLVLEPRPKRHIL